MKRRIHLHEPPIIPSTTLNGKFVKEGENSPYYGFPEPRYINGKRIPRFEVFHDCYFNDTCPLPKQPKVFDWTAKAESDVFGSLFGEERRKEDWINHLDRVLTDDNFDPTKLITPAIGTVRGWRKTYSWMNTEGKKLSISIGEGPMFSEYESSESSESSQSSPRSYDESDDESQIRKVSRTLGIISISDSCSFDNANK